MLRQPILCVLGHIDHGKTSLLDSIRQTRVQAREVGGITQHIGASEMPLEVIKEFCKPVLAKLPLQFTIPGLLFIDTPGHDAFTNLRKRGGSVADLAILVVDCTKGVEAQTVEAIQILREYKTPFLVAFNKIDALSGWVSKGLVFTDSFALQGPDVQADLENRIYALIGKLYEYGFQAERFDRVTDFTKQILVVPVSAKTREGLSELLLYAAGLAQKFLEKKLVLSKKAKGSVLEVREEKGLGKTLDVILYDGVIRKGQKIAFATQEGSVVSKIKALLKPKPLDEMRDPRQKFDSVESVSAASGVKVSCENAEKAIAGSSLLDAEEDEAEALKKIKEELSAVMFETDQQGVIVKADSLGSLEAVTRLLQSESVPVKKTGIGRVTKNDVAVAAAIRLSNPFIGVVFAFHETLDDETSLFAEKEGIKVFEEKIIYNLILSYKEWVESEVKKRSQFSSLVLPAKIKILVGHCFRASNPCIVGVEVLDGRLRKGYSLMSDKGERVGVVRSLQEQKQSVEEASKGRKLAVSIEGPTFGRQVTENQVLYVDVPKEHAKLLEEKHAASLSDEELALLQEIKKIKGLVLFR